MSSSLKFQLSILVYLFFFLSSFPFYGTSTKFFMPFFNVNVIDELIDPLDMDCAINGITQPRVSLRQSHLHKYSVDVGAQEEATLLCNMTSGPRSGSFLLFKYSRDIPRCEIKDKRCTWNLMPTGLYLFFNSQQNLIFNWTMSS
ncbi:hypothetical protein RDI58_023342 [Solanum bulbocastanum]|uniref:S-protein homolog n=1 Tax=Solanum bulbocastanum TaxID=147425 RepID=A0AAN8T3M4_SOLBU